MEPAPLHPRPESGLPPFPVERPLRHAILFGITFVTLALAGGFFWEGLVPAEGDLLSLGGAWELFSSGLVYASSVALILGAHEMGHYLACRYYRIPASLPFFIPSIPPIGTFGAVIRIRGVIPDRRALFDVAAAGPIAGFAVALPILLIGFWTAETAPALESAQGLLGRPLLLLWLPKLLGNDTTIVVNSMYGAGWVGMLVTSLNLFPVGQLDGGHVAFAISRRFHRQVSYATLLGLLVLIGSQLLAGRIPAYVLWFLVLSWMRDRHPPVYSPGLPLDRRRRWIAVLLLVIFLISFIPLPI